jgi:hypothetical protein
LLTLDNGNHRVAIVVYSGATRRIYEVNE